MPALQPDALPVRGSSETKKRDGRDSLQSARHYGTCALAFVAGGAVVGAAHYLLRGTAVQLAPEAFVSLVFTIAVGAASLVLAVLAINYGRISERVMTERADRSIDIQMDLFQKSLGLQTQLFDKTMSTLESIGRSTGVTEQRLSDIHSLMQNPGLLKQIAGRAVEQTTSEMTKTGKEPPKEELERLTKNIARELSAQWEQSFGASRESVSPRVARATPAQPSGEARLRETLASIKKDVERRKQRDKLFRTFRDAVAEVPDAKLEDTPFKRYWDYLMTLGKTRIGVDLRVSSSPKALETFTESIQELLKEGDTDYLLFVMASAPSNEIMNLIDAVNREFNDRVYLTVASDEQRLRQDIRSVLQKPPVTER